MEIIGKNKKGLKLVTKPISGCEIFCRRFLSYPKIIIGNLSIPFHDIIIPFSLFSLSLATLDKKQEITKI